MKKMIIICILFNVIISSALLANLSKLIHIPHNSQILSFTFRYIDTNGNMQTQKLKSHISLTLDGIFLTQSKEDNFLAKIEIKDISNINALIIEYKDQSHNKFFKPIYYNLEMLSKNKPLYIMQKNMSTQTNMENKKDNMPITFNNEDNEIIDGFILDDKKYPSYSKKDFNDNNKNKVMKSKKYRIEYINNIVRPVIVDGFNITKKEKHFCTIPIRDNIFYFVNEKEKALFVIFKDFELSSSMSIENNKLTLTFEQENKFKPCLLTNINKYIAKMSAYHEEHNHGEAWFHLELFSNIKSASIVYPKEKSDIMSYNEELKDIIVYKIEY